MQLQQSIKNVFVQLGDTLDQLSDEQYTKQSKTLFSATIGQHVRHIIELFMCLENGYEPGLINYEKRKRDLRIESDKEFARLLLIKTYKELNRSNKILSIEANYDDHSSEALLVESNYYREVLYNLEHTIHHMALIRVGISEVSTIEVPEGFGVAASTIKYKKTCAQ